MQIENYNIEYVDINFIKIVHTHKDTIELLLDFFFNFCSGCVEVPNEGAAKIM